LSFKKKPEKEEKEIAKEVEEKEVEEKDVETIENKDELKTNVIDQADEDFQTKKSPKQGEVVAYSGESIFSIYTTKSLPKYSLLCFQTS
jgi:hypothetical protein